MVLKVKEVFDLFVIFDMFFGVIFEEVQDFKFVWVLFFIIWKNFNELCEILWNSVQLRKIWFFIDNLIKMIKDMFSRMCQYVVFEYIQNIFCQFMKVNFMLVEFKLEVVCDRYWIKIYKQIKFGKWYLFVLMMLGDVWDFNFVVIEVIVKDIIIQVQGEMVLEEFLK